MIQEVIYPLMCYSDEDEDLWTNDPHEYIRVKYGEFMAIFSFKIKVGRLLLFFCKIILLRKSQASHIYFFIRQLNYTLFRSNLYVSGLGVSSSKFTVTG